jgi:hypothetical protein
LRAGSHIGWRAGNGIIEISGNQRLDGSRTAGNQHDFGAKAMLGKQTRIFSDPEHTLPGMDGHVRQGQFLCRGAARKPDEKKNTDRKKESFRENFHSSSVSGLLRSLFYVNACNAVTQSGSLLSPLAGLVYPLIITDTTCSKTI